MSPLSFEEADNMSAQIFDDIMLIEMVELDVMQSQKDVNEFKSLKARGR